VNHHIPLELVNNYHGNGLMLYLHFWTNSGQIDGLNMFKSFYIILHPPFFVWTTVLMGSITMNHEKNRQILLAEQHGEKPPCLSVESKFLIYFFVGSTWYNHNLN